MRTFSAALIICTAAILGVLGDPSVAESGLLFAMACFGVALAVFDL